MEVFDRRPGYDPKLEPIVRIEARRLRSHLDAYYGTGDASRTVRISIPKGGYAPAFEIRDSAVVAMPSRLQPIAAATKPPRQWNCRLVAVGTAGALLAGAVTWIILRQPHSADSPPAEVNITSFPGWEVQPSFSPDGSQLVFSWDGGPSHVASIYTMMTSGGPPRPLTSGPGKDFAGVWSPDGNWIAFVRNHRDVLLISPLGGPERKVAEAGYPSLAWAPDSKSLAIVDTPASGGPLSIFEVSLAGGQKRRLTSPPDGSGDFWMAYSPDGRRLAVARSGTDCDLSLLTLSSGTMRPLKKLKDCAAGLTWTLDGRDIIYAAGPMHGSKLWRLPMSPLGEPTEVPGTADNVTDPAIGRAGFSTSNMRLAYVYMSRDTDIWEAPLTLPGASRRTASRRVIASTSVDSSPQYSPDGRRVVFISGRSGFDEVWLCDSDGSNPMQLTFFHNGSAGSPRWSPDSTHIVFDYLERQGRAIYIVNTAGGPPVRLTAWGEVGRPSWSRDGRRIYFFWTRSGERQVWRIPAKDAPGPLPDPVQVTDGGGMESYESTDGEYLYYTRRNELWKQPVAGGSASHVLGPVWHGYWAITAKGIFFVNMQPAGLAADSKPVMFFSFETNRVTKAAEIQGGLFGSRPDFCVSPDGTRMLYGLEQVSNADIRMLDPFR